MGGDLSSQEIQKFKVKGRTLVESDDFKLLGDITESGKVFVHIVIKTRFTKDVMLDIDEAFDEVLYSLHEAGVNEVFTIMKETDEKMSRFVRYFGFEPRFALHNPGEETVLYAIYSRGT